jgi:hypothetical protein
VRVALAEVPAGCAAAIAAALSQAPGDGQPLRAELVRA